MFALRCTKKLLARIDHSVPLEREAPRPTTRMGDWTANLLFIGRQQLVLAVSNITLLPVLLPAAPFRTAAQRVVDAARQMFHMLGIRPTEIAGEMVAMREWVVAPTNDRRVLGSMADFDRMLESYLGGRPLVDVALHLAEAPCSPLGMESPRRATLALFSRAGLRSNPRMLRLVKE